jgi:hypothetical protein
MSKVRTRIAEDGWTEALCQRCKKWKIAGLFPPCTFVSAGPTNGWCISCCSAVDGERPRMNAAPSPTRPMKRRERDRLGLPAPPGSPGAEGKA